MATTLERPAVLPVFCPRCNSVIGHYVQDRGRQAIRLKCGTLSHAPAQLRCNRCKEWNRFLGA